MTKRRTSQNKAKSRARLIAWISYSVAFLVSITIAVGAGYYFGFKEGKDHVEKTYAQERTATKKMITELKKATTVVPETTTPELAKRLHGVLQRDQKKYSAAHEYTDASVVDKPVERPIKRTTDLPKLAIIVDDVAFARDVRLIKSLNMPLTMSFLPPSANHPDSAKLAASEPYYMVHLPMEAKNFSAEEPSTLRTRNSQFEISQRIAEIKQLFPKVQYVNNHTGSTFTSNETAMNRLIFALNKHKIGFIDSRTTAETKVPTVMKNYGKSYLARDVFLDHHPDIESVKKQIKRAIKVAKKHGSAIAICHPHKKTLEALKQSKELLKEVELVRIDQLI
jgi:polysaccharide deacetylase 2 family uncharacterized protein YibQ